MSIKPHGIIPAIITPFTADEEINEAPLRALTSRLINAGVHGLFATGSQGEFWALTVEEKCQVWEIVVDEAAGRVPVYAGTAAVSTREAVALTRLAEKMGADAVSVLTPFFITPNDDELYDHFRAIAASTALPVLLYSNPGRTQITLSPAVAARLAKIENIVGIKDSSGDMALTKEYIRATPDDFSVLMGTDTLILEGLAAGASGAIAATGNVAPEVVVKIYNCFEAADLEGARGAQDLLANLRKATTLGTYPGVFKEAVTMLGIDCGPARRPVAPMSEENRERLAEILREMDLM